MLISEIFTSIQGESSHAGAICFFIRLAGCNLNCSYCDTRYAARVGEAEFKEPDELLRLVRKSGVSLVEITGGEPLLQKDSARLCQLLLADKLKILLETNGSLPIDSVPREVVRIVDCKTPSSGEADSFLPENFDLLTPNDEMKFVVGDQDDVEYAEAVIKRYQLATRVSNLWLSPVSGRMPPSKLAEIMIRRRIPAKLQLQLHKIIWGNERKGV